jgi:Ca2+-binding RTX toxin-like protein
VSGGILSGFSGSGSAYSATYTAINFQSATGTISVSNNYFDAVNNQGIANSSNVSFTVGGGSDPRDNDNNALGASVVRTSTGNGGDETINGTPGADTINGNSGDDLIYGGGGVDTLGGDAGSDTLYGGSGNDSLTGGPAADIIYGGSGNDIINGIAANDIIAGGFGADTLTGGNGDDTFYFFSIYDQQDTITDFIGNGDTANVIVFDTVGPSAFTSLGSPGAINYSNAIANGFLTYNADVLSYDADGSAGTTFTPLPIVTLTGTPTLNNTRVLFQNLTV